MSGDPPAGGGRVRAETSPTATRYVAVVGAGEPGPGEAHTAAAVGRAVARAGAVLVCGGLGGVMEAACRGAKETGGLTVGILPGTSRGAANRFVDIALPTGMGEARNALVVGTADAVVAVGGEFGTLSEIALALKTGVPVVGLGTWELAKGGTPVDAVVPASGAEEAVETALALAGGRGRGGRAGVVRGGVVRGAPEKGSVGSRPVPSEDHSLLLILARQLASNVATPMFVVDAKGVLAFYNEAAEAILGQSFSATGPIGPELWGGSMFQPEDTDGNPITVESLPLGRTLMDRRPAHSRFRITGLDGVKHTLEATSMPLFAKVDELAGAVAVFWEDGAEGPG